jgi:hypothetical protein
MDSSLTHRGGPGRGRGPRSAGHPGRCCSARSVASPALSGSPSTRTARRRGSTPSRPGRGWSAAVEVDRLGPPPTNLRTSSSVPIAATLQSHCERTRRRTAAGHAAARPSSTGVVDLQIELRDVGFPDSLAQTSAGSRGELARTTAPSVPPSVSYTLDCVRDLMRLDVCLTPRSPLR